jgi:hypothetical protein
VRDHDVGIVLPAATAEAFDASVPDVRALIFDTGASDRCRATARRIFDVNDAVVRYHALYDRLGAGPRAA